MVAITPATAEGSGLVKFGNVYPERFFDVGICEQHAVTMAAGMAKAGIKPVVSIYSTFLQRAMDQVIHDVAILNLPVVFGIDRGGLVEDGETHQGVFDIAFLRSIPNFTVIAPKDTGELRNMLYTALKKSKGPVAIRFPRDKAVNPEAATQDFLEIDYTKWEILKQPQTNARNGKGEKASLILLAYGAMVNAAASALAAIEQAGITTVLVNARSAKPLDDAMLEHLFDGRAEKIITLEEATLAGGFGAAVLEWACVYGGKYPGVKQPEIACLGVRDHFVEHGSRAILLKDNGLSPETIAESAIKMVKGAHCSFAV